MRATTVRFGSDLWAMLEREAARSGVSVAQYVREAALTRIAYSAGRRGDDPFDSAPPLEPKDEKDEKPTRREKMDELAQDADAVRAQARQAMRHAEQLAEKVRAREASPVRRGSRPA